MNIKLRNLPGRELIGLTMVLACTAQAGWINVTPSDPLGKHIVDGITGARQGQTVSFVLSAGEERINTPDGNTLYIWGYADASAPALLFQYPGPTLIVNQGDTVKITLSNTLPVAVSIVFPGQKGIVATGGTNGLLTREAPVGGTVNYQFTASQPGTYVYNSGTQPSLQVELGLVGALIVRPSGFSLSNTNTWRAYASADSAFDHEYLFLLTEMDPIIHLRFERQIAQYKAALATAPSNTPPFVANIDMTDYFANYWFINGRCAPDTMMIANSKSLPVQPYDGFPIMHPGQNLLMRMIGGGRDAHPFHHHGNHARIIARDGRLLSSNPTNAAPSSDLSYLVFTTSAYPGQTSDGIFTYTGERLGWDMYGHTSTNDALRPFEYPGDHGKIFPVRLPTEQDMEFGQWYGGSPFLGVSAALPPGTGGFNPNGGYMYLWHSHNEREIVNYNVFPGGMLTLLLVEPWP